MHILMGNATESLYSYMHNINANSIDNGYYMMDNIIDNKMFNIMDYLMGNL